MRPDGLCTLKTHGAMPLPQLHVIHSALRDRYDTRKKADTSAESQPENGVRPVRRDVPYASRGQIRALPQERPAVTLLLQRPGPL